MPNALVRNAQIYTGLAVAPFLLFHLIHSGSAFFGADAYIKLLGAGKRWYQHPVLEAFLLTSIVAHVLISTYRIWYRGALNMRGLFFVAWKDNAIQRMAGRIVSVLIINHVLVTRVFDFIYPQYALPVEDGKYELIRHSLSRFGILMAAYYVVYGVAGATHMSLGTMAAFPNALGRRPARTVAIAVGAFASAGVVSMTIDRTPGKYNAILDEQFSEIALFRVLGAAVDFVNQFLPTALLTGQHSGEEL